ncbi:hypothetical protein L1887_32110 [Cichorium endivia]|nr:hypothetical protein L1887_32110 [Cichorium endivia]
MNPIEDDGGTFNKEIDNMMGDQDEACVQNPAIYELLIHPKLKYKKNSKSTTSRNHGFKIHSKLKFKRNPKSVTTTSLIPRLSGKQYQQFLSLFVYVKSHNGVPPTANMA